MIHIALQLLEVVHWVIGSMMMVLKAQMLIAVVCYSWKMMVPYLPDTRLLIDKGSEDDTVSILMQGVLEVHIL